MNIPTVKRCCWLDLKTVGIIYGCIGIIFCGSVISVILSVGPKVFFACLPIALFGSIFVCWILGIHERKPNFMIPVLIFSAALSFVLFNLAFVFPTFWICGTALSGSMGYVTIGELEFGVCILGCLISVSHAYLTIAKYSLYKIVSGEA